MATAPRVTGWDGEHFRVRVAEAPPDVMICPAGGAILRAYLITYPIVAVPVHDWYELVMTPDEFELRYHDEVPI